MGFDTLQSRRALYQLSYQGSIAGRGSNLQHKTKANLKPLCYGTVYLLWSVGKLSPFYSEFPERPVTPRPEGAAVCDGKGVGQTQSTCHAHNTMSLQFPHLHVCVCEGDVVRQGKTR